MGNADSAFETEISAPSSVINSIAVGQAVRVVVPELANLEFGGTITEVGSRAREVAAFPVVAVLNDPSESVRAGMSAEVAVRLDLASGDEGFLIPITCFAFDAVGQIQPDKTDATVFVYDPDPSTVRKRKIAVSEVRENAAIVREGLEVGELVASAGVSYLRDGQKVKLLRDDD